MNNKQLNFVLSIMAAALCGGFCRAQADSMGTAFTYQGRLVTTDGPANGNYEFKFSLYDAVSGDAQVGTTQGPLALSVTGGLFTVLLDFGPVFQGDLRYLEIMARTNAGPTWTTLPRQPLTPAPNALFAAYAGSAYQAATLPPSAVDHNLLYSDYLSLSKVSGGFMSAILSSGNVGIGTNSPMAKLHVAGNTVVSGTVGVGTSSPEVALHVVSDGYYAGLVESSHSAGTSFVLRSHPPGVAKVEWSLNMQPADDPYGHAGSLYFLSGGNTVPPTATPLVLAMNGNVGIGMDPTVRLDVNGDIKANSKSVVVGEDSLRIVRGVVDWNGNVYAGSGFTSTKVGTGAYKITFTNPFSGLPSVTATAEVPSGTGLDMIACMITTNTVNSVSIGTRGTTGAGYDRRFHFIAIGAR